MNNFDVRFEEDAKFDIAEAFDWYSEISKEISKRFLEEIMLAVQYLENEPQQFKIVYKKFRQVPLKKFPFVLLYKIDGNIVKIFRVFPTRKNPKNKFEILR